MEINVHILHQKHPVADLYMRLSSASKTQLFKGQIHQPGFHFTDNNYSESEQCSVVSFSSFSWETAPFAASMHIYPETKIMQNLRLTDNTVSSFSSLEILKTKPNQIPQYSSIHRQHDLSASLKLRGV